MYLPPLFPPLIASGIVGGAYKIKLNSRYKTTSMKEILEKLRNRLAENAFEENRQSGLRFFKEQVKLYGVKTDLTGRIAKEFYKEVQHLPKQELFALCEELWKSGFMEESFVACEWTYAGRKNFKPDDFEIFQNWIGLYVKNWASCDTFCNHTIGKFIVNYPEYIESLKKWARSRNMWLRRAAAVSLIVPAKEGNFLNDIFEIAEILLTDKEDLVQKGYGWMLKAASKHHEQEVFDFVVKNKKVMPRTALRYAIEKMPPEKRRQAMER